VFLIENTQHFGEAGEADEPPRTGTTHMPFSAAKDATA
jgi:hypothetical protein